MNQRFVSNLLENGDFWFFPETGEGQIFRLANQPSAIRQSYSEIVIAGNLLLKRIRYQTMADQLRKPFRSQAKREREASHKLQAIGVNAPSVYAYGINLSPLGGYESMLLMDYVQNLGTMPEFMKEESNTNIRRQLVEKLCRDLQKMIEASLYHKDAHPGNILVTPSFDLVWIDNDLSPLRGKREYTRLFKKFLRSRIFTKEEKGKIETLHSRYRTRFER